MTRAITKVYGPDIKGLSLSGNIFLRDIPFSKIFRNIIMNSNNEMEKRNGFAIASQQGGYLEEFVGCTRYLRKSQKGVTTEELLTWRNNGSNASTLYKIVEQTLNIAYVGAGTATFRFFINAGSRWEADLQVNSVSVGTYPIEYGIGIETSPDLLTTLRDDISAIADFTATLTGTTDYPAAALGPIDTTTVTASTDFTYFGYEEIETGNDGGNSLEDVAFDDYTIPSAAQINKAVYFARHQRGSVDINTAQSKGIWKYDGVRCYRSGMPDPNGIHSPSGYTIASLAGTGGPGPMADGVYNYRIRAKRIDANYNEIFSKYDTLEGTILDTTGAGTFLQFLVALDSGLFSELQFGIKQATLSGIGPYTTATAHGFVTGDIVYAQNVGDVDVTVSELTRLSATTFSLEPNPGLAIGDTISNRAFEIYRTIAGGATWYLVADQTEMLAPGYRDDTVDASLVLRPLLVEDLIDRLLPIEGAKITEHQGLMAVSGVPGDNTAVYVSDINPEYMPRSNNFDASQQGEGSVTGIGSHNDKLVIFKEESHIIVHGNLRVVDPEQPPDINVEDVKGGIGCMAQASIVEGDEGLYFLSKKGPQRFSQGQLDPLFSGRLIPFFKDGINDGTILTGAVPDTYSGKIILRNAVATYDDLRKLYILAIPKQVITSSIINGPLTNELKYFVYEELLDEIAAGEFLGDRWYNWQSDTGFAQGGLHGLAVFDNTIWGVSAYVGSASDRKRTSAFRELTLDSRLRFADNTSSIQSEYHTSWEDLGNPDVYKQMIRARVWRAQRSGTIGGNVTIRVFKNYQDESVAANAFAEKVLDFTDTATIQERAKLKNDKVNSFLVALSNNTIYQDFRVSGLSMNLKVDYEGGDIEKIS